MNAKVRRTQRTRTEADVQVLHRELLDPRGCCVRCHELIDRRAIYCDKHRPRKDG